MMLRFTAAGICLLCFTACGKRGGEPAAGERAAETRSRVSERSARPAEPALAERLARIPREARNGDDVEKRDRELAEIAWEAVGLEPSLAREAMAMISPDSPGLAPLVAHIAMRMTEEDADGAVAWADGLEPPSRDAAFSKIAVVIAADDPVRGATLAAEKLPPGREQDLAVVGVLQRWAVDDAPAAAAWLEGFGPGESRAAGARELLGAWGRRDPAAALMWAGALPGGDFRKEAAAGCAAFLTALPPVDSIRFFGGADADFRLEIESIMAAENTSDGLIVFPTHSNSEN